MIAVCDGFALVAGESKGRCTRCARSQPLVLTPAPAAEGRPALLLLVKEGQNSPIRAPPGPDPPSVCGGCYGWRGCSLPRFGWKGTRLPRLCARGSASRCRFNVKLGARVIVIVIEANRVAGGGSGPGGARPSSDTWPLGLRCAKLAAQRTWGSAAGPRSRTSRRGDPRPSSGMRQ